MRLSAATTRCEDLLPPQRRSSGHVGAHGDGSQLVRSSHALAPGKTTCHLRRVSAVIARETAMRAKENRRCASGACFRIPQWRRRLTPATGRLLVVRGNTDFRRVRGASPRWFI
jgi:hypothetical protein